MQDYHAGTNIFQQITVQFYNHDILPPQTIHNVLYMLCVSVLSCVLIISTFLTIPVQSWLFLTPHFADYYIQQFH